MEQLPDIEFKQQPQRTEREIMEKNKALTVKHLTQKAGPYRETLYTIIKPSMTMWQPHRGKGYKPGLK